MKIYNSLDEIIGNTPLLRLRNTEKAHSLTARLFAKTEYFNPAGSVKDRTAKFMIDSAEKSGVLKRGMTLIEPTSGNTGIALAAIGASKGYKVILTMPETMSVERRKLISAYGAEIVLTDGKKGMAGAIEKAEQLKGELNGSLSYYRSGDMERYGRNRGYFCRGRRYGRNGYGRRQVSEK